MSGAPGFYGKLPSHGDFVTRGLPESFVDPLDAWLREGMAASRQALGEAWLDAFLTSPVWNLALAAGCCGPSAAVGVMLPSVDRVGRYFPFLLVAPMANSPSPWQIRASSEPWLQQARELALSVLADDFDLDRFMAASSSLGDPPVPPPPSQLGPGLVAETDAQLAFQLAALAPLGSLWWTEGGAVGSPKLMAFAGQPPAAMFSELLDGRSGRGEPVEALS